jgi:hypothetical protein
LRDLVERAMTGQSPDHTKRSGDRPAHRTPADTTEGGRTDEQPGNREVADGGAADEAFRVLRPPSDGREHLESLLRVASRAEKLAPVETVIRAAA